MKKTFKTFVEILVHALISLAVCIIIILSIVLFLAMPDILEWVSDYLGELTTYSLFFLGVGAFIYWGFTNK